MDFHHPFNAPVKRRLDGHPAKRQLHPRHHFTGESYANFTPGALARPVPIKYHFNKNRAWAVRCKRLVVNMKKEDDPRSAGRRLDPDQG